MKKLTILTVILISFMLIIPCSCAPYIPRVTDDADILTDSEEALLLEYLDEISERLEFDIAVCTVQSIGGYSAMDYADNFYENNGFGFGTSHDGTLLLIAMDEREWWITTEGYGRAVLDDYNLMLIENEIIDYLSAGDYYSAFAKYAEMCNSFVNDDRSGYYDDQYYDDDYIYYPDGYYGEDYYDSDFSKTSFGAVITAIIIGFIISLICVSVMKGQLKSVRRATGASSYEVAGSLRVTRSQDLFLYRTVRKIRIDNDSSSSSRGGSSSVHRSSSGRSHGGRGGRF